MEDLIKKKISRLKKGIKQLKDSRGLRRDKRRQHNNLIKYHIAEWKSRDDAIHEIEHLFKTHDLRKIAAQLDDEHDKKNANKDTDKNATTPTTSTSSNITTSESASSNTTSMPSNDDWTSKIKSISASYDLAHQSSNSNQSNSNIFNNSSQSDTNYQDNPNNNQTY